jgi:hypothetical protein
MRIFHELDHVSPAVQALDQTTTIHTLISPVGAKLALKDTVFDFLIAIALPLRECGHGQIVPM